MLTEWGVGRVSSLFFLKFYLFIYLIQQVLIIYFIHISVYMSIPISQFIPLPAQEATFVQYKDPSILRD